MRTKLLMALLAALAIAALGVVPAAASAATVSLTNQAGESLSVGSKITAVSTDFKLEFSSGTAECGEVAFSAEVTKNNANPAAVEGLGTPQFQNCQVNIGGGGTLPLEFTYADIGTINFNADGTTGGIPLVYTWIFNEANECQGEGTLGAKWNANPGALSFLGYMPAEQTEAESCFVEGQTMSGSFSLTGENGKAIKIVSKP